jgi:hypothetical protein
MPRITFAEGIEVYYRGMYGKVYFVCEKYITICVRKMEHKSKDVCLLVYPSQYDEIILAKESTK